ncbi:hypothetical protein PQR33_14885 [Paraburkholderia sediminicola]|uniref:hypothetical protein n=1 Tax=Paraburkholderia sediminicola TaxID=458836 RepID=UPI0038B6BBA8
MPAIVQMSSESFDIDTFIRSHCIGRKILVATMRELTEKALPVSTMPPSTPDEVLLEPRLFAWHFSSSRDTVDVAEVLTGKFRSHLVIPGTSIEIVECVDTVVGAFFRDHVDASRELELAENPAMHIPRIAEALELIERCAPDFHEALATSLRSIVLFRHPSAASFAALGMHGMIFLNLSHRPSTTFFVDGLVHQGGHVVFSEATIHRQCYFNLPPDTELEQVIGYQDGRTVYEALHGLYTEFALVDVMDRARFASQISAQEAIELHGRTEFIWKRFEADLRHLSPHANVIFSEVGLNLFNHFRHVYDAARARRRTSSTFDLGGQADEFDVDEFYRRNRAASLGPLGFAGKSVCRQPWTTRQK